MACELVSVIVPLYNKERHIAATLESIINQDYENYEVIIVDDASSDSGAGIAENLLTHSKIKFKFITHNINKGVSAARNKGLEASQGKYILFFDADDIAQKNLISTLTNLAEKYDCDISFGGYTKRFEDGRPDEIETFNIKAAPSLNNEQAMRIRILNKVAPHLCTTLFRKSMLDKYKLRFYDGCTAFEDIEFQLKAFCHAQRVSFTGESLYIYVHGSEMGGVRDNDTDAKKLQRYIDSSQAHYRAAKYISDNTKSERVKFLADNLLLPEAEIRNFTIYARANDREKFDLLLKDEAIRKTLKSSRKVFFMKPEVYLKAFTILHMPNLYFKLRKKA